MIVRVERLGEKGLLRSSFKPMMQAWFFVKSFAKREFRHYRSPLVIETKFKSKS